ncbi:MAG: hypothetical protein WAM95_13650 [Bacillus sp. (in: firmicutes)]|jgi:hypothetical protein
MNKDQVTTVINNEGKYDNNGYDGFKIIEVNVSSSSDTLYAVCTPVKMK